MNACWSLQHNRKPQSSLRSSGKSVRLPKSRIDDRYVSWICSFTGRSEQIFIRIVRAGDGPTAAEVTTVTNPQKLMRLADNVPYVNKPLGEHFQVDVGASAPANGSSSGTCSPPGVDAASRIRVIHSMSSLVLTLRS